MLSFHLEQDKNHSPSMFRLCKSAHKNYCSSPADRKQPLDLKPCKKISIEAGSLIRTIFKFERSCIMHIDHRSKITSESIDFKDRYGGVEKLENRKVTKTDMAFEGQEGLSFKKGQRKR